MVLYDPKFIKTMIDFYKQNKSADIVTLYGEKFTDNNFDETKLVTNLIKFFILVDMIFHTIYLTIKIKLKKYISECSYLEKYFRWSLNKIYV